LVQLADEVDTMAEEKKENKEKKPLNVMLIMQIAFAVVNLGVIGWGGFLVYASTLGWHAPQITEEHLAEESVAEEKAGGQGRGPLIYTMDKFTVNLDGEPKRTIRLEVNLEMLGKDGFEEIISTDNRAKARDKIVRMLNEKSFGELESIQGKLFLKDRIAMEINSILDKGVVKDVYFSEFVVQ
jgi:flagellar FliL protein